MTEQEIEHICDQYGIKNYTINSDGSIDVDGSVYISGYRLSKLPLKFNRIRYNFYCGNNSLTTFENFPIEVGGDFICDFNRLKSLVGSPIKIGGYLSFIGYNLETLDGLSIPYDKLMYYDPNLQELIRNHKRKKNLKIINQL